MNNNQLYTCGWDSKVKLNNVVNLRTDSASPIQMEVNGEVIEKGSEAKHSLEKVKCNGTDLTVDTENGGSQLETT